MKIWVYAIAKNERQFCERFMRSCAGADGVAVLDTGSTDGTAEKLRELGAAAAEDFPQKLFREGFVTGDFTLSIT